MVLTVVFPAYNEEASVQKVVLDHVRVLNQLGDAIDDWEMVCVDDASSDRTREILAELAKQVPELRVLSHTENLGIFSSYADLFSAARGTHIYLTASDGQWPAENLLKMLPAVVGGADLVVGVRQNRGEVYSLSRRAISFLFNLLPLLLFGVKTSDAGSIKLGSREVFNCDLISNSPFAEAERIIRTRLQGKRVEEVPIEFLPRRAGKERGASWRNIRRSLIDCICCAAVYRLRPVSRVS